MSIKRESIERVSAIASTAILFTGAAVGNALAHSSSHPLYVYTGLLFVFTLMSLAAASTYRLEALASAASFSAMGFVFEALGVRTGLPFGGYRYSYQLMGTSALGVPLSVVLAWGLFGYLAYVSADFMARGNRVLTVILASTLMVMLDMALDPIMVSLGAWTWLWGLRPYWYGVPWSNFLGWFVVSALATTIVTVTRPKIMGSRSTRSPIWGLYAVHNEVLMASLAAAAPEAAAIPSKIAFAISLAIVTPLLAWAYLASPKTASTSRL